MQDDCLIAIRTEQGKSSSSLHLGWKKENGMGSKTALEMSSSQLKVRAVPETTYHPATIPTTFYSTDYF